MCRPTLGDCDKVLYGNIIPDRCVAEKAAVSVTIEQSDPRPVGHRTADGRETHLETFALRVGCETLLRKSRGGDLVAFVLVHDMDGVMCFKASELPLVCRGENVGAIFHQPAFELFLGQVGVHISRAVRPTSGGSLGTEDSCDILPASDLTLRHRVSAYHA